MNTYLPTIIITLIVVVIILMANSLILKQQVIKLEQQQYADRRYIVYLEGYLENCQLYYDYDEIKKGWTEQ